MSIPDHYCAHNILPYDCTAPECGFRETAKERDRYKLAILEAARTLAISPVMDSAGLEAMALDLARCAGFTGGPVGMYGWLEKKWRAYSSVQETHT